MRGDRHKYVYRNIVSIISKEKLGSRIVCRNVEGRGMAANKVRCDIHRAIIRRAGKIWRRRHLCHHLSHRIAREACGMARADYRRQ